jgi:hypothetical protein
VLEVGPKCGSLRGSAVLDEEWMATRVIVRARPSGGGRDAHAFVSWPGRFELRGLLPGRYDISFEMADDFGEPILVVGGVDVAADQATRDPRLRDVDLRGRARVITLRVRRDDGMPVRSLRFALRASGEAEWRVRGTTAGDTLEIATASRRIDVELGAKGTRTTILANVIADREVVLALEAARE